MDKAKSFPLVAVDVGNSRVKLGFYERAPLGAALQPARTTAVSLDWEHGQFEACLSSGALQHQWLITSVHGPAAARLEGWLREHGASRVRQLDLADLPLKIDVPLRVRVGMDRLVNAVAANQMRDSKRPAIVVDLGSANTVDLVSAQGAFLGGAILPGIAMSARALHESTNLLPLLGLADLPGPNSLAAPTPLGTDTPAAMKAGLFWGTVGAINEMIRQLSTGPMLPEVILTGGAAAPVAAHIQCADRTPAKHVPYLTLLGVALSACRSNG
jgi:type III pantothenate kinase